MTEPVDLLLGLKLCESPIEQKMLTALRDLPLFPQPELFRSWQAYIEADSLDERRIVAVIPQAKVGPYRADFLVATRKGDTYARVVVECDGFDFHAAEDEQAIADKQRDRAMRDMGFWVCRFTGSEITTQAALCVKEVANKLFDAAKAP